jgi:hypothetical protein
VTTVEGAAKLTAMVIAVGAERDAAIARAERAEAALADGVYWNSACGNMFEFGDGVSFADHEWMYCPYCGQPISAQEVQP